MKTFLITGIAGFIGSSIARRLLAEGNRVRGIDNFSTGKPENLAGLDVDVHEGDIRDSAALKMVCKGVHCVFHEAAIASVPRSIENPSETHEVNATGTLNVLGAALDAKVKRVVYAGSSAAYGDFCEPRVREDRCPQPISPYASSKLCGEHYMSAFSQCFGIETITLRYFNVFGPRQDPSSMYSGVIAKFIESMSNGIPPTIYGDGEQTRDFTFINDVVTANCLAVAASSSIASGTIINVATGRSTSLNETYRQLKSILRFDSNPKYESARVGDIRHSCADISRAQDLLGYTPQFGMQQGLQETVDWYLRSFCSNDKSCACEHCYQELAPRTSL